MTRLRWVAALTAVAGAGLVSGCCGGFGFGCPRRHDCCECSSLGTGPVVGTLTGHVMGEGPILEDPGTYAGPPYAGPPYAGPPYAGPPPVGLPPQPGPMLTPVPGTTTEPPIAQPTPAPGSMSRRTVK
jgi:hypothetical protein